LWLVETPQSVSTSHFLSEFRKIKLIGLILHDNHYKKKKRGKFHLAFLFKKINRQA